jgi:hypothetical protein
MSEQKKPTPEELLDALTGEEPDDEAERIASLSDVDLDRELASQGFDPAEVRATGKALAAKVVQTRKASGGEDSRHVVPAPPRNEPRRLRPRRVAWRVALLAAAVLAILAMGGAGLVTLFHRGEEPIRPDIFDAPPFRPEPPPEKLAAQLRDEASAACDARLWARCEAKLDEASRLDPAGESDPRVQQLRERERAGQADAGPPKDTKPQGR